MLTVAQKQNLMFCSTNLIKNRRKRRNGDQTNNLSRLSRLLKV